MRKEEVTDSRDKVRVKRVLVSNKVIFMTRGGTKKSQSWVFRVSWVFRFHSISVFQFHSWAGVEWRGKVSHRTPISQRLHLSLSKSHWLLTPSVGSGPHILQTLMMIIPKLSLITPVLFKGLSPPTKLFLWRGGSYIYSSVTPRGSKEHGNFFHELSVLKSWVYIHSSRSFIFEKRKNSIFIHPDLHVLRV